MREREQERFRSLGHGFVALITKVEFLYKADNLHALEADGDI